MADTNSLSSLAVACAGLIGALWLLTAAAIHLHAARRLRSMSQLEQAYARLNALALASPAFPLIVGADGDIVPDARAAELLEIPAGRPTRITDETGLPDCLRHLARAIATVSSTGNSFVCRFGRGEGKGIVTARGGPAPPSFPVGSTLIWLEDATGYAKEIEDLQAETSRLAGTLDALTSLFEAAPFPIWHRGPDLRLVLVNGAYVKAVGASEASAVVQSGMELIDEGEGRGALSQAAAVLRDGRTSVRLVPATVTGERRMMRVVEVPVATGVSGYANDVEDLEQARGELARFVDAQREMLDRLSAAVAQFGRDRTLNFVNQPFTRLFGLAADAVAGRPEFERLLDRMREHRTLPETRDFPQWKAERRAWFLSDEACEEDWLVPGGKHLRVVAQPLPDGGLLLIFEDRTEQNQLASARDTLLRVRTATFNNLFEAVGVFASDGRLYLWNDRFRDIWAFDEEELAVHPRIDALLPAIAAKLKRSSLASYVRELVRSATVERKQRNGRVSFADGRDFAFAAVPLPDGNALFTMLDITDSRRIEATLQERNDALEQADRVKTAFVANMSYELRTPLTSINGFAEMLAGGYAGALPPLAADYVAAITDAAARLSTLVDNVLDLTHGDIGALPLTAEQVDIRDLCARVADREGRRATGRRISIDLQVDATAGEIEGDRRRLEQALGNVVRNAISHSGEQGRVTIRATGSSRAIEVEVSDTGCGISPADQARVFDRFQRLARDAQRDEGSLGLGLPLARQIAEAHGGSVRLTSEVDVGTTVTFFLPRSQ